MQLGIGKDKALSISRAVQRYGNLIGFGELYLYACGAISSVQSSWMIQSFSHDSRVNILLLANVCAKLYVAFNS